MNQEANLKKENCQVMAVGFHQQMKTEYMLSKSNVIITNKQKIVSLVKYFNNWQYRGLNLILGRPVFIEIVSC